MFCNVPFSALHLSPVINQKHQSSTDFVLLNMLYVVYWSDLILDYARTSIENRDQTRTIYKCIIRFRCSSLTHSVGGGYFATHISFHSSKSRSGPHHSFFLGNRPYLLIISALANPPRWALLRARENLCFHVDRYE